MDQLYQSCLMYWLCILNSIMVTEIWTFLPLSALWWVFVLGLLRSSCYLEMANTTYELTSKWWCVTQSFCLLFWSIPGTFCCLYITILEGVFLFDKEVTFIAQVQRALTRGTRILWMSQVWPGNPELQFLEQNSNVIIAHLTFEASSIGLFGHIISFNSQ